MNRRQNTLQLIFALFPEEIPSSNNVGTIKENSSIVQEKLREIGEVLHMRLVDKTDSTITATLSELFFPLLVKSLKASFHYLPDLHLIETIAADTLMKYLENPEKFDPSKRSLIGYLYMDAYWDLKNLIEKPKKVVELYPQFAEYEVNTITTETDPEKLLLERENQQLDENSFILRIVRSVIVDPVDRKVLELMMEGVRETHQYAKVLSLEKLLPGKQASTVKKHKDRIKKAIQRALKRRV
jgi:DNA-directed RNA polymerase specialized sigma24 family protein